MARPKSLIKNIQITDAKRTHNCKSNSTHRINKGEFRFTVKEGQSERNYCLDCGKKFLESAIDELSFLHKRIEETTKLNRQNA